MCSNASSQQNIDCVAHFGFYPVCVALYVENHSVVAQKAGAGVSRFDVGWTGPIRLLDLANPRVEGAANVGVLI